MDTSAKNFKYSKLKKLICLALCFITMMISTGLAVVCAMAYTYDDGKISENPADSSAFRSEFVSDISYVNQNIQNQINKDTLAEKLAEKRNDIVDEAYKKFVEKNAMLKREYKNSEEFGKEILDGDESTTFVDESINDWSDEPIQIKTDILIVDNESFNNTFDFSYTDVASQCENYSENSALENVDEDEVKSILNSLYDTFESDSIDRNYNNYHYAYPDEHIKSLKYYVEYEEYSFTNIENFNENEIAKNDIYYIYDAGKVSSGGISEDNVSLMTHYSFSQDSYRNYTAYFYFDFSDDNLKDGTYKSNIIDKIRYYDRYQELKEFHPVAVKTMNYFNAYAAVAVICLIASCIFGFAYLFAAGKKDENSPAKPAITDKIPFEIHLAVNIVLGVGAAYLTMHSFDFMGVSKFFIGMSLLFAAAAWLLIMEFCASVARYAKSEKIFYRNFLIVMILRFVIKTCRKIFNFFIKTNKKIFGSIKRFYEYAPKKFSKKVFAAAALYIFANAFLFTFTSVCACSGAGVLAFLSALTIIGGNTAALIFLLRYIKLLDEIISAASNHQEYTGDMNALPKSLKTLAEGINYTSVELQNAINQAVKDERLRTELITNVSHDLKTPLTSIISYVDLLSKCNIEDETAQKYIKVIDEKGAKLKRLIEDLIEASKVTSGNITINASPLNLAELSLQATVDVQSDFEKAGLELVIKDCQNAPVIFADGAKTFRIIENLLSNARKYSAVHSRVYINVYKEGTYGVFEVKNISAQALDISPDELTERFVRGDKSRNQEGNGLGLSIAKELCRAQNGNLEIIIDGDLFKAKVKLPLNK